MKKMTKKNKGLLIGCVIAVIVLAVFVAVALLGGTDNPQPTTPTNPTTQATDPTNKGTQPTQTNPTDPKPTVPKPTDPKPTDPQPTEPKPTDPPEPPHVHEYAEEVTAPTCVDVGYTTYTCECGDSFTGNTVAALGHTYTEEVTPPTCEDAGYTTYTCACGDTKTGNEILALGHSWSQWEVTLEPTEETEGKRVRNCVNCDAVEEGTIPQLNPSHTHSYTKEITEPTCTEGGYTVYTCSCGDTYQADEVAALGHNFTDYESNKDATCITDGTRTAKCNRCEVTDTIIDQGSATGHAYEDVVTEPTCTVGGYTTYTCRVCGDVCRDGKTEPLGHSFVDYRSNNDATCFADGTKTAKCERCDVTDTVPDEGSKLEHMYEAIPTEPTCTEGGYTTYTCISCGDTYISDEVAAIGHNWSEWEVILEPTEEVEGKAERICSNCNEKEEKVLPKQDHVHEYTTQVTEPTCEGGGYTTYTCACGHSYNGDETEALGHEWTEWAEDPAPTCEDGGKKVRRCTRCSIEQSQALEALGHDYSVVVTPASCTEAGHTTSTCRRCNEVVVSDEVPAKGHSFGAWTVIKEPTEESNGEEQRKCVNCSEVEKRPIGSLPHTHSYLFTYISPTCTEKGYTLCVCKCGESYKEDYVDALGHAYVKTVVEPTCETKGHTDYTCSACGDAYTDSETAALGHKWSTWVSVLNPTCLLVGSEERTCGNCGNVESRDVDALSGMKDVTYATVTYNGSMNVRSGPSTDYAKLGTIGYGTQLEVYSTTQIGSQTWAAVKYMDYVSAWIRIDGYAELETVKEPVGHIWGDWEDTQAATCLAAGKQERACANCDETQKRNTEKVGHSWGEWETVEGSTCTGGIRKERTCSVCGEKEAEVTAAAHAYTHWTVHEAATCYKDGSRSRSCVNCGEVEEETLEALGHDWKGWEIVKPATTTEEGEWQRFCKTCGYGEIYIAPVKGTHTHNYEKIVVPATCTEGGYTYKVCLGCGLEMDHFNETNATGHNWSEWETTLEPQIGKVGYEQRTCTTCGETMAVAIPPLDENGNAYEQYLDSRLTTDTNPDAYMYYSRDGGTNISCVDFRSWGAGPSVWINEDGTMTVVYYNMAGERIEVLLHLPQDGYVRRLAIQEDGTYEIAQIGGYG